MPSLPGKKVLKIFLIYFKINLKAYNILTIKAPRCGGIESAKEAKQEEVFNETFCSNLQRAFAAQH